MVCDTSADSHGVSSAAIGAIGALMGDSADPFGGVRALQSKVAFAATAKVMRIQRAMGEEMVALLDPNLGTKVDRRA